MSITRLVFDAYGGYHVNWYVNSLLLRPIAWLTCDLPPEHVPFVKLNDRVYRVYMEMISSLAHSAQ